MSDTDPSDVRCIDMKERAMDRYGHRIASRLTGGLLAFPDGTAASLQKARELALLRKKVA